MKIKIMLRKIVYVSLICIIFSCTKKQEAVQHVDREGNVFTPPPQAERVISTTPATTEIIAALGQAHRLVAYDIYSKKIEGINPELPALDMLNPNIESMIECKPDLIIEHSLNRGTGERFSLLQSVGITVVYVPTSNSVSGIYEDIRFIASVLNVQQKGEAIIEQMQNEVEKIKKIAATISAQKKVYFEIEPPPYAATTGKNTYLDDVLSTIGAINIFSDSSGFVFPSGEEIITRNPDVIISNFSTNPQSASEILNRKGFETITAVKNKAVYLIDADGSSRPSNKIVYAMWDIARCIYPEYFNE